MDIAAHKDHPIAEAWWKHLKERGHNLTRYAKSYFCAGFEYIAQNATHMKLTTTPLSSLNKWISYSGMATAFLAVHEKANAQVLYTDVDPDVVIMTNDSLQIDFDDDGLMDMTIIHESSASTLNSVFSSQKVRVRMIHGGDVLMQLQSNTGYPSMLASGAPIAPGDPNLQHIPSYGALLASHFTYNAATINFGQWPGQSGYMGFDFFAADGLLHYGWLQLAVSTGSDSVTVLSYGYESIAGVGVNAGDGGAAAISEAQATSFTMRIWPNPTSDNALITFPNNGNGKVRISLVNSLGEVLRNEQLGNVDNYTLDLGDVASGVYFVRLQKDTKVAFQKVVKK